MVSTPLWKSNVDEAEWAHHIGCEYTSLCLCACVRVCVHLCGAMSWFSVFRQGFMLVLWGTCCWLSQVQRADLNLGLMTVGVIVIMGNIRIFFFWEQHMFPSLQGCKITKQSCWGVLMVWIIRIILKFANFLSLTVYYCAYYLIKMYNVPQIWILLSL